MEGHPSHLAAKRKAAAKVAAMTSLKMRGDKVGLNAMMAEIRDGAELTLGYQAIVEQLAIELSKVTDRLPADILSDLVIYCEPTTAPPGDPHG